MEEIKKEQQMERLNEAFQYLRSIGKAHTKNDVAKTMNANRVTISNAFNNKLNYLNNEFLDRFNESFGGVFNIEWLTNGEGDMLSGLEYKNEPVQSFVESSKEKCIKGVPYFEETECTGGILSMYNDKPEKPSFYINYEHFNDCTAYIPVTGDSMYPKYCSGEIVAVKQIHNLDVMLWGEVYLVVTNSNANDLRTIKEVHPHDDASKLVLRASNPNYRGDTVVDKRDIVSLFIVKGKIKRNQL